MRRVPVPAVLTLALAASPAWSVAQESEDPVPDSIAHPIVVQSGPGCRLDAPSYLWMVAEGEGLSRDERAALEEAESVLRGRNAPLGRKWHGEPLDQQERAAVLGALRANYQLWWESVQEALGAERARTLMETLPAGYDESAGEIRCLRRSLLAILRLE